MNDEFSNISPEAWEQINKAQDEYTAFGTSMMVLTVTKLNDGPALEFKHIPIRKQHDILGAADEH